MFDCVWERVHRGQTSELAFFVLFSGILFNIKWKHGQGCIKWLVHVTIFNFFFKITSLFSLKTDQNCLGLSKIMLANGADNSAVHLPLIVQDVGSFDVATIFRLLRVGSQCSLLIAVTRRNLRCAEL